MIEALLASILEIFGYIFYGICVFFNWLFKSGKTPIKKEFKSENSILRDTIIAIIFFSFFILIIYLLS